MIDERTTLLTLTPHKKLLVSVSNYHVPVLHNFRAKNEKDIFQDTLARLRLISNLNKTQG